MLKVSVRKIKKKYNQTECLAHPTHLPCCFFNSLNFYKNFNLPERSLSDTSEVEGLLTVKLF